MRRHPASVSLSPLLLLPLLVAAACGGGGGGGGAVGNPAQPPTATTSTSIDGIWLCVESEVVAATTVDVTAYEPGAALEIWQGQLIGRVDTMESYLRADIESELGFALGWYTNRATPTGIEFHAGYDRLAQGADPYVAFQNIGLRLAVTGTDELTGYMAEEIQEAADLSRSSWSVALRFMRISSQPATNSDEDTELGIAFAEAAAEHNGTRHSLPRLRSSRDDE